MKSPWPAFLSLVFLATVSGVAEKAFPEIHPDRTISFQLRAPKVSNVVLTLEASAVKHPMEKSADGLWTLTLGPLEPDIYGYSFWLDGVRVADLSGLAVKPEPRPVSSMFEIPADRPQFYDFDPAVPHGTVRLHDYESKSLGRLRRLRVYTPPGYDQNPRTRYPVLVLLHGGFDTEATWTDYGRAHFMLDNLLAAGKATPMIIVMVDGFAERNPAGASSAASASDPTAFKDDLLKDALPFVEHNYRTKPGPQNRAITGLSMGGGQALAIGLMHPERFAWVGGMSGSPSNRERVLGETVKDSKKTNQRLKLLWFACGKSDGMMKANEELDQSLSRAGIHHTFVPMEGGHEWTVWRSLERSFLRKK